MATLVEKMNNFYKEDLLKEVGQSPDKIRTILHKLLSTDKRPEYYKYKNPGLLGYHDADFMQPVDNGEGRRLPTRMIRLKDGRMVSVGDMNLQTAYCVLSHRWQGNEIQYDDFNKARDDARKRALEQKNDKEEAAEMDSNDVSIVLAWSKRQIKEQAEKIEKFLAEKSIIESIKDQAEFLDGKAKGKSDGTSAPWRKASEIMAVVAAAVVAVKEEEAKGKKERDGAKSKKKEEKDEEKEEPFAPESRKRIDQAIEGLLVLKYNEIQTEERHRRKQKTKTRLSTKYYTDRMETSLFKDVIKATVLRIDTRSNLTIDTGSNATVGRSLSSNDQTESTYKTDYIAQKSKERYETAVKKAEDARAKYDDAKACVDKLHRHLMDAVSTLVPMLEKWQSVLKLQKAMAEADRLFDTHLFPVHEERYIWSDTCCLNQKDASEAATSHSQMGDWYAEADFCLVHLDQSIDRPAYQPEQAAVYWMSFCGRSRCFELDGDKLIYAESAGPKRIINSFEEFLKLRTTKGKRKWPDWITRGWTLQELVMSKLLYFANTTWTPLGRPIEGLGYIYPLIPFIGLYTSQFGRHNPNENVMTVDDEKIAKAVKIFTNHGVLTYRQTVEAGVRDVVCEGDEIQLHCLQRETDHSDLQKGQKLAMILNCLGFRFPTDMSPQTTSSAMAQAVYQTVVELDMEARRPTRSTRLDVLNSLCQERSLRNSAEADAFAVKEDAINCLLCTLVACTERQIQADRNGIALANGVEDLAAWTDGLMRTGFPAQQILALSCDRKLTKTTDISYCLMGVLGVRFQMFHSEGLKRALMRLLDEVVISTNDVSVFNWVGINMRSPIHGRSMYPASHKAYRDHEKATSLNYDSDDDDDCTDRAMQYNDLMSDEVRQKQRDVMITFGEVVQMLQETIDYVRICDHHTIPVVLMNAIVDHIFSGSFLDLKPLAPSLHKVLLYIGNRLLSLKDRKDKGLPDGKGGKGRKGGDKGDNKPFARPMASISVPFLSKDKSEDDKETRDETKVDNTKYDKDTKSRMRLTDLSIRPPASASKLLSSSKMSFKSGKKAKSAAEELFPEPSAPIREEALQPTLGMTPELAFEDTTSTVLKLVASVEEEEEETDKEKTSFQMEEWKLLAKAVGEKVDPLLKSSSELPLGLIEEIEKTAEEESKKPKGKGRESKDFYRIAESRGEDVGKSLDNWALKGYISPNPVIVNNAGIESMFDIQRVVIMMLDDDILRRRVENAVHANQIISGWCTISTGFSMIAVNFACEKHILEAQLEVMEVVQNTITYGGRVGTWENIKTLIVGGDKKGKMAKQEDEGKDEKERGKDRTVEDEESGKMAEGEGKHAEKSNARKDEEDIARVIQHIQEPDLTQVAGEWVLARFSGTAKASWFLCHLELGTTHQFYGHRIATSQIDFDNATIEPGLLSAWQTYTERKKRKMCRILQYYMTSTQSGKIAQENLNKGVNFMNRTAVNLPGKRWTQLGTQPETAAGLSTMGEEEDAVEYRTDDEREEQRQHAEEDQDQEFNEQGGGLEDDGKTKSKFGHILDDGSSALRHIGLSAYNELISNFTALKADHLHNHLTSAVLKKTPPELRAAVLSLDENRELLPSMYHGSVKVHMF